MASIWACSEVIKTPTKLAGWLQPEQAQLILGKAAAAYILEHDKIAKNANKERLRHKTISSTEVHIMRGKGVVAHFWIELVSPPSKPTGGDIYRNASAKGA